MTTAILDASVVLALLKEERGGTKVAGVLADAAIGAVNFAEVVSHFVRLGVPSDEIGTMLHALPFTIVSADTDLAWEAGRLRATTADAGLSLGDRFCLALAKREKLPAWTADKAWKTIADAVGVKVMLIR